MTRKMLVFSLLAQFVLAAIFALYHPALAGPPLICWPFDIGNAKSLPFEGPGWRATKADYDPGKLVGDTLALLLPETPVIVRMETLRRATIYASKDPRSAKELLARLQTRATEAEAKGRPAALASFDAGYLIECYKQANGMFAQPNPALGMDGYGLVQKAIRQRGRDPEVEFAAAMITITVEGAARKNFNDHLQKALAGAAEGSLLAKNLVRQAQLLRLQGKTIAELRSYAGIAKN